jgi:hypothetical protein
MVGLRRRRWGTTSDPDSESDGRGYRDHHAYAWRDLLQQIHDFLAPLQ